MNIVIRRNKSGHWVARKFGNPGPFLNHAVSFSRDAVLELAEIYWNRRR